MDREFSYYFKLLVLMKVNLRTLIKTLFYKILKNKQIFILKNRKNYNHWCNI